MLQLYDLAGAEEERRFSPYCWRARLALAHKRLPVETIPWRFTEKDRLTPSGQGRVPVLVDGGRWIADSWAIAEHLEDAYPDRPSLFGGKEARALTRFYNAWADGVLQPALVRFTVLDIWRHVHDKDKEYFRQSREKRIGTTLEAFTADRAERLDGFRRDLAPLRQVFQAQPFLGGERPLYADYIVFGAFQWARCVSEFQLLKSDDPVAQWRGRMLGLYDGLAGKAVGYPV